MPKSITDSQADLLTTTEAHSPHSQIMHWPRTSTDISGLPQRPAAGFSMSEMIVVIAVLAILSGIVIVSMQGSFGASQEALASARVEMLNSGLHAYSTAHPEMYCLRRDADTNDEFMVLMDMQWRDPDEKKAKPGSPYVPANYTPKSSSSPDDYRIRWTGRVYELLRPGQSGTGFLMVFDGSDFTNPVTFGSNFKPGSR